MIVMDGRISELKYALLLFSIIFVLTIIVKIVNILFLSNYSKFSQ
jgi:hypothetical protein